MLLGIRLCRQSLILRIELVVHHTEEQGWDQGQENHARVPSGQLMGFREVPEGTVRSRWVCMVVRMTRQFKQQCAADWVIGCP